VFILRTATPDDWFYGYFVVLAVVFTVWLHRRVSYGYGFVSSLRQSKKITTLKLPTCGTQAGVQLS